MNQAVTQPDWKVPQELSGPIFHTEEIYSDQVVQDYVQFNLEHTPPGMEILQPIWATSSSV